MERLGLIGCVDCEAWMYADPDEELPCDQCLKDEKEIEIKMASVSNG